MAYFEMQANDGATAAGQPPKPEHVKAIMQARTLDYSREVAEAHKNGNAPPDPGTNGGGQ